MGWSDLQNQCCGSGSGSTWIRIDLAVLIRLGNANLNPDPGALKLAKIYK
jgi:hypothetical protein